MCNDCIEARKTLPESDGVMMPDGEMLKSLEEEDKYKYLGLLEVDHIKHQAMKDAITTEYVRRIRKVLGSKLNGGNNCH